MTPVETSRILFARLAGDAPLPAMMAVAKAMTRRGSSAQLRQRQVAAAHGSESLAVYMLEVDGDLIGAGGDDHWAGAIAHTFSAAGLVADTNKWVSRAPDQDIASVQAQLDQLEPKVAAILLEIDLDTHTAKVPNSHAPTRF